MAGSPTGVQGRIPLVTKYLLANRWYKGLDESGRNLPYKNNCLANYR